MSLSAGNLTRLPAPQEEFASAAEQVLGRGYELSLVFVGNERMRTLNRRYRGKNTTTNVLSFPLSKTSGEIFINLRGLEGYLVLRLFIHALLHLKGYAHGSRMERIETKLCKTFSHDSQYRDGDRRGDAHGAGSCW
ncbi:MAG TPA: hypothetical protein DCZ84_02165 [Candidatus Vogelbacteria bacterium]|uniref:Endoribonuclease YbeY n=1 Tax=Candidatus Vogelbacteria bacterium RIFOXYD1_FULL_51_18 TaxID=1802440 RepID=A0A1G2QIG3_9BACT|nr:MAG: hypothetical protein A2569_01435 [Candidatus Vogelbacteria bacterium RIFOXYD1_FULL_51_18]HBB65416.1 hypothetical protein [Candidatus Vogelbacteria bacterium]HBC43950.1 hypothetical protein [Candidatus Vogelbacteria bacterium]HCQ91757.1 hypothetical protein [Candidatus Vogelbacteria bacterium]